MASSQKIIVFIVSVVRASGFPTLSRYEYAPNMGRVIFVGLDQFQRKPDAKLICVI
jgi:hypothetical protein